MISGSASTENWNCCFHHAGHARPRARHRIPNPTDSQNREAAVPPRGSCHSSLARSRLLQHRETFENSRYVTAPTMGHIDCTSQSSMNPRIAIVAAAIGLAACGSHGDGDASGPQVELNGPYNATGAGPISEITFLDSTHYSLVSSPCTGDRSACIHQGTYVLNAAHDELSLTDGMTGQTDTMPFEAGEAAALNAPISLDALSLNGPNGQPLTTPWPGVALLKNFSAGLLHFTAAQFQMHPGWERLTRHSLGQAGSACLARTDTDVCMQQQSLDWLNAYWLARLSQLAYLDHPGITAALANIGLKTDADHLQFFDNDGTDTHAFYVTTADPPSANSPVLTQPWSTASQDVAVLAFRGTVQTSKLNIKTDLNAWPNRSGSSLGTVDSVRQLAHSARCGPPPATRPPAWKRFSPHATSSTNKTP